MADERYFDTAPAAADRAQAATGSALRWIPAIILAYALIIAPLMLKMRFSGEIDDINVAAAQSNPLNQLFWLLLFAVVLVSARRDLRDIGRFLFNPVILLILLYLGFATLSVLWSPVSSIAFRRLVLQGIVVLALGISTALVDDRDAMLDRVLAVLAATVLLNVAVVLLTPPGPIGHEGIYSQKNSLGGAMAAAIPFFLYAVATKDGMRRVFYAGLIAIALFVLVMSKSKTSLGLAIMVPALVFAILAIARPLRMNAALLVLFSLGFGLAGWFYFSALTDFGFADLSLFLFNDETFTGRTYIWKFAVDVIGRSPLIGQGYASFWGAGQGSIVEREAPGFIVDLLQAHNGYLDTLLETGAVGFSILIALILAALFVAARSAVRRPAIAWLSMTLVLTAVFHNTLESSWFRGYATIWMLFVFAALLPRSENAAPVPGPRGNSPRR